MARTVAHARLERAARELHPRALRLAALAHVGRLVLHALLAKVALGRGAGGAGGRERGNAVTHTKGTLVAEELAGHGRAVKGARHDLERVQPALGRALAEARLHGEELEEVARLECAAGEASAQPCLSKLTYPVRSGPFACLA